MGDSLASQTYFFCFFFVRRNEEKYAWLTRLVTRCGVEGEFTCPNGAILTNTPYLPAVIDICKIHQEI